MSGESHGIREFLEGCEAVLMGGTTFEPALTNDRRPWPDLDVFIGALDTLEPVVLPLLFGGGTRLTPALSPATAHPAVELVYSRKGSRPPLPSGPASRRRAPAHNAVMA
ncbi:dihydrofolate reductase family protein, partial [Streptomyces sp. NPDC004561]